MAGVPQSGVQQYTDDLIDLGCVSHWSRCDPKKAVGVVKRDVAQIATTPGTAVRRPNTGKEYTSSLPLIERKRVTPQAYLDLGNGRVFVTSLSDFDAVVDEISALEAREVVVGYDLPSDDALAVGHLLRLSSMSLFHRSW